MDERLSREILRQLLVALPEYGTRQPQVAWHGPPGHTYMQCFSSHGQVPAGWCLESQEVAGLAFTP